MLPVLRANLISAAMEALRETTDPSTRRSETGGGSPQSGEVEATESAPHPSDACVYKARGSFFGMEVTQPWVEGKGENLDRMA